MRSLENVTTKNCHEVMAFAARALAADRVTPQGHDAIRVAAQQLQDVVNSAVGASPEARRAIETVRRRRRGMPKNSDVLNAVRTNNLKREERENRSQELAR